MNQAPYFHFFRDYNTKIYVKHIGQQKNKDETISLILTFTMFFDDKYYTFTGHSSNLEHISISNGNEIRDILLKKERVVTCKGLHNHSIQLDLKFTEDELRQINS